MNRFKKLTAIALTGIMGIGLLAGCAGASGGAAGDAAAGETAFTVGYCNGADSDVFMVARKDALIKAVEGTDIQLKFADANADSTKQLGDADTFIAQKVDLLVLVPNDAEAIVPAIESANAAGIPVICLGIKAASGDYTFVGSENFDAGHMQGEYMAKELPQNAKVLYLAGTAGMDHSAARREGFNTALTEAGRADIEILADLDGDYQLAKAMQITEDWIQKYPQFDAIIAANDQMALGAVEALKGADRLTNVKITGVDGLTDAYTAIKNGEMVQTILQDAPGQATAAFDVIQKIQKGETPEKEVLVAFQSITAENVDQFAS